MKRMNLGGIEEGRGCGWDWGWGWGWDEFLIVVLAWQKKLVFIKF